MHNTPGRADTNDRTSHRLFSRRAKPFFFSSPFYPPHSHLTKRAGRTPHRCRGKRIGKKEKKRKLGLLDILCVLPFSYSWPMGGKTNRHEEKLKRSGVGSIFILIGSIICVYVCTTSRVFFCFVLGYLPHQTCVVSTWDRPRPPIFNWPLKVGRDHQLSAFSLSRFFPKLSFHLSC
jgi:hypothetical protein